MFQVGIYSRRYGKLEIKEYDTLLKAKFAGGKSIKGYFHHDYYWITEDGHDIEMKEYGYDEKFVLRDFKSYATCCREALGGWEFSPEAFRWFVWHEYIEPSENFFACEAGMYDLTQRFRNVGIAVHNGCLPPEFD